ncbi:tail fiber domain-containing protein [Spirosoma sp.]|uniref:tail fiber domain-containing protein n=1 Tax=Spirosoma sp. TaxID=1899569 RepID=UPI003B3A2B85
MKKTLFKILAILTLTTSYTMAQVGVGTTNPKAYFNVADGRNVLFGQDVSGLGTKLIWSPSKTAFRVGSIDADQWDDTQIGIRSFGIGYNVLANNANTFAIGFRVTASGNNSTALGNNVSTNNYPGSFIIGDYGGYVYNSTAGNQMTMRFGNGYMLYTSNDVQTSATGVKLSSGGNAWQIISDSTRKENFRVADGSAFLRKIARMRLGSWNDKGQDARQSRHYGPMAQDFFAAFGHDELGIIGEDKSINQADFDGVNLIAIQALIKEIEQLKADNKTLLSENAALKTQTHARLNKIEALLEQQATGKSLTFKP